LLLRHLHRPPSSGVVLLHHGGGTARRAGDDFHRRPVVPGQFRDPRPLVGRGQVGLLDSLNGSPVEPPEPHVVAKGGNAVSMPRGCRAPWLPSPRYCVAVARKQNPGAARGSGLAAPLGSQSRVGVIFRRFLSLTSSERHRFCLDQLFVRRPLRPRPARPRPSRTSVPGSEAPRGKNNNVSQPTPPESVMS